MRRFVFAFIIVFFFVCLCAFFFYLGAKQTKWDVSDMKPAVIDEVSDTHETGEKIDLMQKKDDEVTLLFGGDLMFDRSIRQQVTKNGSEFLLLPLHDFLQAQDVVIANLEGPITANSSLSVGSIAGERNNFLFTFDTSTAALLARENIRIVNLGNNHIGNFGADGIAQTKAALKEANIAYFGNTGVKDETRSYIQTLRGLTIGYVNYNQFTPTGLSSVMDDIAKVRPVVDILIVYTHWGIEYEILAPGNIVRLGHSFVDAGADLVIGSHPHVVEQSEVYNGKYIYYSLGNFIFDQYFQPETQVGLLVQVRIDPKTKTITAKEFPIRLKLNGQTELQKM